MARLILPVVLEADIAAAARAAFPHECCGLVEGVRDGEVRRAMVLHPARNLAIAPDRFEIAPQDHFSALRAARARGHALIGCYHSHPGGAPRPSQSDLAGADETDFLWLIAATDGTTCEIAAWCYGESGFSAAVWQTA